MTKPNKSQLEQRHRCRRGITLLVNDWNETPPPKSRFQTVFSLKRESVDCRNPREIHWIQTAQLPNRPFLNRELLSSHMMAAPIIMTTYWLPCCEFTPETRSIGVDNCPVFINTQASAQPFITYLSKAWDTNYVSSFFMKPYWLFI